MKTIRHSFLVATAVVSMNAVQAQTPLLNSYPSAKATVYLDFDGQYVAGTVWNGNGPIDAKPSGLSSHSITEIFSQIAEDFSPFNLNITTDSAIFNKAPLLQRIRIIFTPTNSWFGHSGGATFVGSFTWGDDTPAWVFNNLLSNNSKYVAVTGSHEIGHALGLKHQSIYDADCHKISEYNSGKGNGENGWAPIMGVGYYKKSSRWIIGTSTAGCSNLQDDLSIIADSINNFGFRNEENSGTVDVREFGLKGQSKNNLITLSWNWQPLDTIENFIVESSMDGTNFQTKATVNASTHIFTFYQELRAELTYRVKGIPANKGTAKYSNIIHLNGQELDKKVLVRDYLTQSILTVTSKGNYNFQLLDISGRLFGKGVLHPGLNYIPVTNSVNGLLLLHWQNENSQGVEKLIKQ